MSEPLTPCDRINQPVNHPKQGFFLDDKYRQKVFEAL
jgi:hypothetical protein